MNNDEKKSGSCGCDHKHEHHHDEHCGCGHEHGHEHHHDEHCGCGHEYEHEHHHHHDEHCGCGHEHDIPHDHEIHPHKAAAGEKQRVFILENLGCANCAAKMEKKISQLDGVSDAVIIFATKQLRVCGKDPESLLPQYQEICSSIEPEVKVVPRPSAADRKSSESNDTNTAASIKKSGRLNENTKTIFTLTVGAVLFICGIILEHQDAGLMISLPLNIIAYLILGAPILLTSLKNIAKGNVFDENFLMSIATLGAFAIGDYPEAVGVMLFYRIGEFFEHVAVEKSRSQIMDAVDLRPEVVNLISGDEVLEIPAGEAVVGDILLVRPGDRIPLDGVIVSGESRLDTSALTGEPVPVSVKSGDSVMSGCVNTSGQIKIRVEKPLEESMVSRILDSVENAAASKPKIDRFITRFARIYTPVVVLIALCTAVIPSLISGNRSHWIYTALTFLVISCPCALVLSVPLAYFSGIGAGSRRGILFKGGVVLEQLANIKVVILDKTGTVTEGNFVVQDISEEGSLNKNELLSLAAGCEQSSTHPIANSIVTAARERGLYLEKPSSMEEIAGFGIQAVIGGKSVLCGNRKLMEKNNINLNAYKNTGFGSEVLIAVDGQYQGHIVISDTIKKDAADSIASLKRHGITTVMLTGDSREGAEAVAAQTGIDEVHSRLLPQDKLTELQKIRNIHEKVMFVGDGINDAPVLAGADVGAAMGSGADAAIEAADVVFMNSNMESIVQAISIARSTAKISWQNVVFALIVKAAVMILGLTGYASMWLAVFADTGVAMLCVLNSIRILYRK